MKHISVPVGFEVKVSRSRRRLGGKLIAMNWDEQGRLRPRSRWIIRTNRSREGEGRDRIVICAYRTASVVSADKVTLFADKLSIATSLLPYAGGIIVPSAAHALLEGHRRRRQSGRAVRCCSPVEHGRHLHAGLSNPHWRVRQLIYGMGVACGVQRHGERREVDVPAGVLQIQLASGGRCSLFRVLPVKQPANASLAIGNQTRILPLHIQQHVGALASTNPPNLRQYRERLPARPHAHPQPVLREGQALRRRCCRTSPRTTTWSPLPRSGERRRVHGRVQLLDLHGPHVPEGILETASRCLRTHGLLHGAFALAGRKATFKARMGWNLLAFDDEWVASTGRQVGPDGHMGDRLVQLHRSAQPQPAGFTTGKGNGQQRRSATRRTAASTAWSTRRRSPNRAREP
ncbi:MAG: hypothetical protein U0791_12230 [Gemmataceae bacterium]